MILIADSGSTKTDWVLWNPKEDNSSSFKTIGLNPYFVDSRQISVTLSSILNKEEGTGIDELHFYGSGCGSKESIKTVSEGLKVSCPNAKIFIEHDLMAAARALHGNKRGIACILGTGSNACLYNGNDITKEAISFGYVMGDEGSGNHLGRLLLKSIFSRRAPIHIIEAFNTTYPEVNLSYLLEQLYHSSSPNRFLASFSPFILKYQEDEFVHGLINLSFNQFLDEFVMDFMVDNDYPVSFQGSIAYKYRDLIIRVLEQRGLVLGKIIKEPISALLDYHRNLING